MGAPLFLPRRPAGSQPQTGAVVRPEWLARKLKFAYLPPLGYVNLADRKTAAQSTPMGALGATVAGLNYQGNSRAEFPLTLDASKGLTLISIWRARAGGNYLSADGLPAIASTRTASNAGWTWGHGNAVGGAANGNLVPQSITFQGVAQYTESNNTIEAFVDTPVACRYDPVTGKISWFRFGLRSSPDTIVSAPSAGGNLVFGAQGDYAGNGLPWIDRAACLFAFETALSDAEIAALTGNVQSVWQLFAAPQRILPLAAASGGTTFSYTASGGFTLSGTATTVRSATKTAAGGLQLSGSAATARGAVRSASGGFQLSGSAAQVRSKAFTASGGISFSGAASVLKSVARLASGGLTISGAASAIFTAATQNRIVTAAGGFALSGTAAVIRVCTRATSGGISFAGAAATSFQRAGAVIGGWINMARRRRRE